MPRHTEPRHKASALPGHLPPDAVREKSEASRSARAARKHGDEKTEAYLRRLTILYEITDSIAQA